MSQQMRAAQNICCVKCDHNQYRPIIEDIFKRFSESQWSVSPRWALSFHIESK